MHIVKVVLIFDHDVVFKSHYLDMRQKKNYCWIFLMVLLTWNSFGQWSSDPTENKQISYMRPFHMISDENGGAIIAITTNNATTWGDIYIQRIDKNGDPQWISSTDSLIPLNVVNAPYDQGINGMVSDAEGGAILSWTDCQRKSNI